MMQLRPKLLAAGFFGLYAALLYYFRATDMYGRHFFEAGAGMAAYNLARLLFGLYLFWMMAATGNGLLARLGLHSVATRPERIAVSFFMGAAFWHAVLFPLGLAGYDRYALFACGSLALLAASLPLFLRMLAAWPRWQLPKGGAYRLLCGLFALAASGFLLAKTLYPGGGHDYYTHYFHYYRLVAESGSVLPNQVWYHFLYSKGAGLYFAAMLLTDPLAPSLVTTGFIAAACLLIYSLLHRATGPSSLWPLVACTLYLGMHIYIRHNSWGHLQKLHELTATGLFALIWCVILSRQYMARAGLWIALMTGLLWLLTLLTHASGVIAALFLGAVAAFAWWRGERQRFALMAWTLLFSAPILLLIPLLNQWMLGLGTEQMILSAWPFVDIRKFYELGLLTELIDQHRGRVGMADAAVALTPYNIYRLFYKNLRLDLLYPLLGGALALYIAGRRWRAEHAVSPEAAAITKALLGFLLVAAIAGFAPSRVYSVSYYRFSSFNFAPVLCVAVLALWAASARLRLAPRLAYRLPLYAVLFTCAFMLTRYRMADFTALLANSARFSTGQYSLADAYRHQQGIVQGGTAITPAAYEAWKLAGGKRIWSFSNDDYCTLPGCRMEAYTSFRLSRHAQEILFGPPETAKRVLKSEGLDYFLLTEKEINNLYDPLLFSPLFSPETIGKHLGIVWTNGTSVLLSWRSASTTPLPAAWIAHYRELLAQSSYPRSGFMEFLKTAYRQVEAAAPGQPVTLLLPWDTQGR